MGSCRCKWIFGNCRRSCRCRCQFWSESSRLAWPQMPHLAACVTAAVLMQPSGSRFQTCWFLRLLFHRRRHVTFPELFSYLARRFFACPGLVAPSQPPQTQYLSHQWAPPKRLDLWPLLLPAKARARGSPVESCLCPGDGQTSLAYSSQSVQCLYINHLLSVNKLLLSYLLLCLLPQCDLIQQHKLFAESLNMLRSAPNFRRKLHCALCALSTKCLNLFKNAQAVKASIYFSHFIEKLID
jgi:hypothetical protein